MQFYILHAWSKQFQRLPFQFIIAISFWLAILLIILIWNKSYNIVSNDRMLVLEYFEMPYNIYRSEINELYYSLNMSQSHLHIHAAHIIFMR